MSDKELKRALHGLALEVDWQKVYYKDRPYAWKQKMLEMADEALAQLKSGHFSDLR